MSVTKINDAIINNEIDAEELLDYFRFQADAKGEEFDLEIEDVEEYIKNIQSKHMESINSKQEKSENGKFKDNKQRSDQQSEKLTSDQIRNRQILLANQKKV